MRPYILDCLCEYNQLSRKDSNAVRERLESDEFKTNFEADNRRTSNPYKYKANEDDITKAKPSKHLQVL